MKKINNNNFKKKSFDFLYNYINYIKILIFCN